MSHGDSETIKVSETGRGKYQVEARVGGVAFLIDEPLSAGGLGSGPNPYDLLSAALGACTTMTIRLYADHKGWPLRRVETVVRHSRSVSIPRTDLIWKLRCKAISTRSSGHGFGNC